MKEQVIVGILLIVGLLIYQQKLPALFKIIWAFFLLITVYQSFWPYYEPTFAPAISNVLAWNMTKEFCMMLLFPIAIFGMSYFHKRLMIVFLKCLMICDAFYLITGHNGFFSATTFDATLIAIFALTWFIYEDPESETNKTANMLGLVFCVIAIACVRGRTAGLVLAVLAISQITQRVKIHVRKPIFYSFIGLVTICCSIFLFCYWPHVITNERIEMWVGFMNWWKMSADPTIGTGLGTFEWIGPAISPESAHKAGYGFFMMHNDWLQLVFETGFIGFIVAVVGYVAVAVKLQGKYLSTWLGLGAGMLFYYPTHAWPVQFLALIIIADALKINSEPEPVLLKPLTDPLAEPILF